MGSRRSAEVYGYRETQRDGIGAGERAEIFRGGCCGYEAGKHWGVERTGNKVYGTNERQRCELSISKNAEANMNISFYFPCPRPQRELESS